MSMNPESENFEQLRRLLVLKRHEQPPPGYFNRFSGLVITRIRAGETGESASAAWWSWESSWLRRLWASLEAKPVLAGAFGVAVCGFFVAGAIVSENIDTAAAVAVGNRTAATDFVQKSPTTPFLEREVAADFPAIPQSPVLQAPKGSLFEQLPEREIRPEARLVSWPLPGPAGN
jgi:hypothetical protein